MIRHSPAARAGAIALFVVPFVFLVFEAIAASAWTDPPYDYIYNWVSHLGVPGGPQRAFGQDLNSPLAWVMNAGLALYGAVAVAAAVLVFRFSTGLRPILLGILLTAFGVGVILVSQFPGSLQAIADGSIVYHLIGAQTAMISGNLFAIFAGLFSARIGIRRGGAIASVVAGIFGLASFIAFMLIFRSGADANFGLLERMAQYPIAIGHWIFAAAVLRGGKLRQAATTAAPAGIAQ